MPKVFFSADVSGEVHARLRELPPDHVLAVLLPWDQVPAELIARPAPDSAVLAEAERLIPRHLSGFGSQESTYRSHLIYWLRVAADVARRSGQ
jgi:hypothetical protein